MILLLTLMLLVLLTFEVATISLVAQRGLGEEGVLSSQNIEARRAAEVALNHLQQNINTYLITHTAAQATTAFANGGGSDLTPATLTITNPTNGATDNTDTTISGWLVERRGYWYHLVGRAQTGSVDILEHRWVMFTPCNGLGILSTLLPASETSPGWWGINIATDGRIYFNENANPGQAWSWKSDTGLSTILGATGGATPTRFYLSSTDDRILLDDGNVGVWSWDPATGLSTIFNSGATVKAYTAGVSSDDRFFFGLSNWSAPASGQFWTWKAGVLSTILPAAVNQPGDQSVSVTSDGRVFFGANANLPYWTWQQGTGLSTLTPAENDIGMWDANTVDSTTDRVFFGSNNGSTEMYTWKAGIGLSTIVSGAGINRPGSDAEVNYSQALQMVYFNTSPWPLGPGQFYAWSIAQGLSTILPATIPTPGTGDTAIASDGRVFFGASPDDGSTVGRFYTWHPTTKLSTILPSDVQSPGRWSTAAGTDDRVYFGEDTSPGQLWVWRSDWGLSTLLPAALNNPGKGNLAITSDNRVFFGDAATPGHLWTWHESTGLSTLLSITGAIQAINTDPNGTVYFGESGGAGQVRRYELHDCSTRGY